MLESTIRYLDAHEHEADVLDWDAVRYVDRLTIQENGRNADREDAIKKAYPAPRHASEAVCCEPRIITDMHGVILGWYLPEALVKDRQVSFPSNQTPCYSIWG
jgi:hypothetical protein